MGQGGQQTLAVSLTNLRSLIPMGVPENKAKRCLTVIPRRLNGVRATHAKSHLSQGYCPWVLRPWSLWHAKYLVREAAPKF